ncbi:MAG TPA: hypothetical protein H9738_15015 [Candidatus Blautia pullistercoris]|uniref:Uncharacterized protein n=1 Tax=Candidatus Blautia pullistercoris TaxID=2838499 RepID=A0A9D1VPG2_9FIRM|nr:hypothetical protein [Candidatus Blautia pullistercoris]
MEKNEEKKNNNKKEYVTPDIEIITIEEDVITNSYESGGEIEGGHSRYNSGMFD